MAVASSFSEIVIQKNDKETLVFLYRGGGGGGVIFLLMPL